MEKFIIISIILLISCGCNEVYFVDTLEGKKEVSLEEALSFAQTFEDIQKLKKQAIFNPQSNDRILAKERELYVKYYPNLSDWVRQSILKGNFCTDMTVEQVEFVLQRKLELLHASSLGYSSYKATLCCYEESPYIRDFYFHFDEGKLSDWSFSPSH